MSNFENQKSRWDDDLLRRDRDADFLYKLVMQKYEAYHTGEGKGALCFALDADWGAGKTFFVKNWSKDVANQQHPVVKFDAWANDLADDPLVGFMSQLKKDLSPLFGKLATAGDANRKEINRKFKAVIKQAGKAALPVVATIGTGLLKKASGIAVEELVEVVKNADSDGDENGEKILDSSDLKKFSEAALEKFFAVAMKSHDDKQKAIAGLKSSIEDLLEDLGKNHGMRLPLFVFIDELDRCRPDYAIRLLEGVKHLFDARGICFVLSTNLKQLAASTAAVYGTNFDGRRYLKRFFSFEYVLDEANNDAFARFLIKDSLLMKRGLIIQSGLPVNGDQNSNFELLVENFAAVSTAFGLPPRTQIQVFRQAEAGAAAIKDGETLHCFYLFFLAAMFHVAPDLFISTSRGAINISSIAAMNFPGCKIKYDDENIDTGRVINKEISIFDLFMEYHQLSLQTYRELSGARSNMYNYPSGVLSHSLQKRSYKPDERPIISKYHSFVRAGGQVR